MITAIIKLWQYFGVVGILSLLLWVSAMSLFACYSRSSLRTKRYWLAFLFAVLGLWFAKVNSVRVSDIKVDLSAELEEAKARLEHKASMVTTEDEEDEEASDKEEDEEDEEASDKEEDEEGGEATGTAAAEGETEGTEAAGTNETERSAEEGEPPSEPEPAYGYRLEGKVDREKGKKIRDTTLTKAETVEASQDSAYERKMKAEDVSLANMLDRLNLFFARFDLWLAIFLLVVDYFSRFNMTFGAYFPLPIACRLTDSMCPPKKLASFVRTARPGGVRDLLESLVRKGETFIYFGERSMWHPDRHGRTELPRVRLIDLGLIPLRRVDCGRGPFEYGSTFVFESAWFGRYCFEVRGDLAGQWLAALVVFLETRLAVLASARRTVNIVWETRGRMDRETLGKLLFLCRETNHRLILLAEEGGPAREEDFDESLAVLDPLDPTVLQKGVAWIRAIVRGERDFQADAARLAAAGKQGWGLAIKWTALTVLFIAAQSRRAAAVGREVWRKAGGKAADTRERLATAKAEMAERRKIARAEAERKRQELEERRRREAEERARREAAEKQAREKAEAERKAREEAEAERRAKEQAEAERRAAEKARREAEEKARREAVERKACEEAETERRAKEKAEAERETAEKTRQEAEEKARREAAERDRREKAEAEQKAREEAEAERRGKEQAEAARRTAEKEMRRDEEHAGERAERKARETTAEAAPADAVTEDAPDQATSMGPTPPSAPVVAGPAGKQSFKFRCPNCNQKLSADSDWVGSTIQCPACERSILIPSTGAAPDEAETFRFSCESCGAKLSAERDWVGLSLECPECNSRILVPPPAGPAS